MEVSKKRKRDVDCPRITFETSTKVFDRLFKEESLEEMKNVVRKKLGLPSSLSVHLSQLRDGNPIVLEDDDDFDAFYASVHSTAVARIMVYLGDDQPSRGGPDPGFTGGPMHSLGPPTIHHAAVDGPSSPKKLKVSFVESTPQPVGDNVKEPNSSLSLANPEPPPEVPATLDVISADTEGAREMMSEQPVGKNVKEPDLSQSLPIPESPPEVPATLDVISADSERAPEASEQPVGNNVEEPNLNQSLPISETPPEVPATLDVISTDAADTRKGPEESEHQTPSIGQVDPSGVDISTRPPKETKKSQNRMEVVIVGKESKKQDPKTPASTSALQTISSYSKRKAKKLGRSQFTTPSKPTLRITPTKKPQKKEPPAEPVEPPEANDKDQALNSATKVAVDAILGKIFSSNGSRETLMRSSPLVDATAPSPSVAPVVPATSPDDQPISPNRTNTITKQVNPAPKCPVCNKRPSHFRSKCPIIRAGIKSMRRRIVELQQDTPDGNDEEREEVIEELRRIIDKKTKRNQTPAREIKSTNGISMADKSVISPSLAADSSSVMVDELQYSSDAPKLPLAQRPPAVVNGISNELDPLFLHSESQQSFPYSQYPNLRHPDSEDEEDEVQASVVKPQTTTNSSAKLFRPLTEIASQPTLFTPTIPLARIIRTKEEVTNLYGRSNKDEEESEDSDSESESDAGTKAQTSHIPLSRRAGAIPSKKR